MYVRISKLIVYVWTAERQQQQQQGKRTATDDAQVQPISVGQNNIICELSAVPCTANAHLRAHSRTARSQFTTNNNKSYAESAATLNSNSYLFTAASTGMIFTSKSLGIDIAQVVMC